MTHKKLLIVGNWKMFKTHQEVRSFIDEVAENAKEYEQTHDFGICVPYVFLEFANNLLKIKHSKIEVYAENCHYEDKGAFTGEISHTMLTSIGINKVLIGHSERRTIFHETDEIINKKMLKLIANDFKIIFCIGETLSEFEAHKTIQVVHSQITKGLSGIKPHELSKVVIAYEPVWAIGTGKVATNEIAQNVHAEIRKILINMYGPEIGHQIIIQYGGSVKPDNIKGLMSQQDIDGALVGGASLEAKSFLELLKNA